MALSQVNQDALNAFFKNLKHMASIADGALPDDMGYQIATVVSSGGASTGNFTFGTGTVSTPTSNITFQPSSASVATLGLSSQFGTGYYELQGSSANFGIRNSSGTGIFPQGNSLFSYVGGNAVSNLTASQFSPNGDLGINLGASNLRWSTLWVNGIQNSGTDIPILTSGDTDGVHITNFGASVPAISFGLYSTTSRYIFGSSGAVSINSGTARVSLGATNNDWSPSSDLNCQLGATGARWSALWTSNIKNATGGITLQSTDANVGVIMKSASGNGILSVDDNTNATLLKYGNSQIKCQGNAVFLTSGGSNGVLPSTDSTEVLGSSSNRWVSVWAKIYATVLGTAIASATTIAPTNGITHITGTAAIATITPPVSGPCQITLIPDGAFTYTGTGNIKLASGSGTAVVNRPMIAIYDGSFWYMSY